MKPAPFEYHKAHSVEEAAALLARGGEDAKVLAGGQSLVAMMNLRLARPSVIVDVNDVPGLSYVFEQDGALRIGALARHCQLEHYPGVLDGFSVLPEAARWVGHYPIRARGTFGGSIAHADSAAEWCMLAVLLDAEIVATKTGGSRTIAVDDFFLGLFMTTLEPDELLTEVRLPHGYTNAALREFARRHGDFAIVAAATAFDLDDGVIRRPRIVLGGVANLPLAVPEAAALLDGERPSAELFEEAGQAVSRSIEPPSDIHGSAEYRKELAGVLVERALADANERPGP